MASTQRSMYQEKVKELEDKCQEMSSELQADIGDRKNAYRSY